jgi:hypothetical protein
MAQAANWTCGTCTFLHEEEAAQFLACSICGCAREEDAGGATVAPAAAEAAAPRSKRSWGSLQPPTPKDITGPRKLRKALDAPPPAFEYLVVLECVLRVLPGACALALLPAALAPRADPAPARSIRPLTHPPIRTPARAQL